MSNKVRNIEAVRIHRPVACGQVRDADEAVVIALVDIMLHENLLPPCPARKMWRGV